MLLLSILRPSPRPAPLRDQVARLSAPLPASDPSPEQLAAKIDAWKLPWQWARIVDGVLVDRWNPGAVAHIDGQKATAIDAVKAGLAVRLAPPQKAAIPPDEAEISQEALARKIDQRRLDFEVLYSYGWRPSHMRAAAFVALGYQIRLAPSAALTDAVLDALAAAPHSEPALCIELHSRNESMLRRLAAILDSIGEPNAAFFNSDCTCASPFCPACQYTGLRITPQTLETLADHVQAAMHQLTTVSDESMTRPQWQAYHAEALLVLAADRFLSAARGHSPKKQDA